MNLPSTRPRLGLGRDATAQYRRSQWAQARLQTAPGRSAWTAGAKGSKPARRKHPRWPSASGTKSSSEDAARGTSRRTRRTALRCPAARAAIGSITRARAGEALSPNSAAGSRPRLAGQVGRQVAALPAGVERHGPGQPGERPGDPEMPRRLGPPRSWVPAPPGCPRCRRQGRRGSRRFLRRRPPGPRGRPAARCPSRPHGRRSAARRAPAAGRGAPPPGPEARRPHGARGWPS